ncbi:MAG: hypothetical protein QG657_173 [Acidobacteriota bacterium]|nr:hypothetical protein [Acidobacteriota bacterium]
MNVYSYIMSNGSGKGYEDVGKSAIGISSSIEAYVIQGAGYYLKAGSSIYQLLAMVELKDSQGLDLIALDKATDSAVANIEKAIETYEALIKTAEATPYNDEVQAKLKSFNYEAFAKAYGLNGVSFAEAAMFLRRGDITGIYKRTYTRLKVIASLLQTIKYDVSRCRVPLIDSFWRLNDAFAETSLLGSYTAQVFSAIL